MAPTGTRDLTPWIAEPATRSYEQTRYQNFTFLSSMIYLLATCTLNLNFLMLITCVFHWPFDLYQATILFQSHAFCALALFVGRHERHLILAAVSANPVIVFSIQY